MTESNSDSTDSKSKTESDLKKLADLCAVGARPIPNDLPENQQRKLMAAIGARRRKRLLHLFAAAIANDIRREQQAQGEPNAEEKFRPEQTIYSSAVCSDVRQETK